MPIYKVSLIGGHDDAMEIKGHEVELHQSIYMELTTEQYQKEQLRHGNLQLDQIDESQVPKDAEVLKPKEAK